MIDVTKCKLVKTLKHGRQMLSCRFSPCGKYVVAGGTDNLILRWELESEKKSELSGHGSWISALTFHPNTDRLFSADLVGTIMAWAYSAETPTPLWTIKEAHSGFLRDLAISPDGKVLATVGSDKLVRLWNSEDGKPIKELAGHEIDVYRVAFHPDGKSLVSGDLLGMVKHWDWESGKPVRHLDAKVLHTRGDEFNFIADVGGVRRFAFNRDGSQLACGGLTESAGNTFCNGKQAVVLIDWATGNSTAKLTVNGGADGPVNGLRYLSDGTLMGCGESGAGSTVVCFWKPGEVAPSHSLPTPCAYELDLHPDGQRAGIVAHEALGQTGNGRLVKTREEYVPNGGSVQIFTLG